MGDKVQLISSGDETAREVSTILYHSKMLNEGEEQSDNLFLTTGKIGLFKEIASKWFGQPIENVKHIHLEKNNSRIYISELLRNQELLFYLAICWVVRPLLIKVSIYKRHSLF